MTNVGYTYAILRYVHDAIACESLNLGIVARDENGKYAFRAISSFGRIRAAFPNANTTGLERIIKSVEGLFSVHFAQASALSLQESVDVVVPKTEGSIKCEVRGSGITNDINATADALFDRLVLRCNEMFRREVVTVLGSRVEYYSSAPQFVPALFSPQIAANDSAALYQDADIEPMLTYAR